MYSVASDYSSVITINILFYSYQQLVLQEHDSRISIFSSRSNFFEEKNQINKIAPRPLACRLAHEKERAYRTKDNVKCKPNRETEDSAAICTTVRIFF